MASVNFGLYESKDERSPYSLFVVSIEDDKILVFSSKDTIGWEASAQPYREWIKDYPNVHEVSRRSIFRYEPYLATCSHRTVPGQVYDDLFFKELFNISNYSYLTDWPFHDSRIFVVLYKDDAFAKEQLPEEMLSVCEAVAIIWREYFDNGLNALPPPHANLKKIIESRDEFKDFTEMAPFFETVTKISSLSYEKSRSRGSISVMERQTDNPLVQFKTTNDESEPLFFSIEYAKQLRKLLEITKGGLSLLVHDRKVYGIGNPIATRSNYMFNITGHMEWHVVDKRGKQLLRYKHGEYYFPKATEIQNWYIRSNIDDDEVLDVIDILLKEDHMKEYEHGALFIITDSADSEVKRLCRYKRGMETEGIDMKSDFEKASALFGIDGALFLDKMGYCHGIGIILDGEAKVNGTPARGSRYNSTKTYISQCVEANIEAYALIISSDGYLDILTSHDDEFAHLRNGETDREDVQ